MAAEERRGSSALTPDLDWSQVRETVLTFEDAHAADEIFLSGNFAKVTAVKAFDDTQYPNRPVTERARALYWDWAATQRLA
mgnify:CR=1 FL=1